MASPQSTPPSSGSPSGRNRRRHERARAEWPIRIHLTDGECEAKIRDISRGGLCFFLDRPIEEMTLLEVAFELPGAPQRILRGQGAVVRCERISARLEHFEIAVFLTEMAQADREAIAQYVEHWQSEA